MREDVFSTNKPWWPGLWCLSQLYPAITTARRYAYKIGIFRSVKLNVPVICVGNITSGGAGKTPLAVFLAGYLEELGYRPAVISRGYKRKKYQISNIKYQNYGNNSFIVSDGKAIKSDWREAGDEPYLIAKRLLDKEIPVVVGADRALAGKTAMELGADCLVMDDGFQHFALQRDLNIVAIDATHPAGNGHLLPAGTLRERPCSLQRAGVVVMTKCNLATEDQLENTRGIIAQNICGTPVIETSYTTSFRQHRANETLPADWIKNRKVIALSGIANPSAFEKGLVQLGAVDVIPARFSDHHIFTSRDTANLQKLAAKDNLPLVTTEKDAVRLPGDFSCVVAIIELNITKGKTEWEKAISAIF